MPTNNPHAFPRPGIEGMNHPQDGMTLRDYFAAKALPIAWQRHADFFCGDSDVINSVNEVADAAYEIADAMLEAREK